VSQNSKNVYIETTFACKRKLKYNKLYDIVQRSADIYLQDDAIQILQMV